MLTVLLAGCSTIQIRREDPATFEQSTSKTLTEFSDCFVAATATADPQYLPRKNGATFSSGAGLYGRYVSWVVDIDDLGARRRVSLHAVDSIWGKNKAMIAKVQSCL